VSSSDQGAGCGLSMQLNMIYARAANGVIGKDGSMPWHLPQDLAHFKSVTLGFPVIMGRKTWDSLPARFRPLPGRINVVVTRQLDWHAQGAVVAHSLSEAIAHCDGHAQAWVMGGAEIYAQALPFAERIEVTEIEADFEGDAYAPVLSQKWHPVARQAHQASDGLKFSFVTYQRR